MFDNTCTLYLCRININPDQDSFEAIMDTTVDLTSALGPEFNVTVTVRNDGPSDSPFSTFTIYWPLTDPEQLDQYFLYPLRITSVSFKVLYGCMHATISCILIQDKSITCSMDYIDPTSINARRRRQSTPSDTTGLTTEVGYILHYILFVGHVCHNIIVHTKLGYNIVF